jgi:hypothetical protein
VHLDFPSSSHRGNRGSVLGSLEGRGTCSTSVGAATRNFPKFLVHFRHLTTCIQIQEIVINKFIGFIFLQKVAPDVRNFENREKNHPSMSMLCFLPNVSNLSAILLLQVTIPPVFDVISL